VTVTAPKPTAGPPFGARLRRRLPKPIERRLPRWKDARPWVILAAGLAAVLLSTAAMWGVNLVLELDRHPTVPGVDRELAVESDFAKHPRNVLILGSDARGGLSPEEQAQFGTEDDVEGERSDTIILLHIDPRREKAVVVHFPRDLLVNIPGHGDDKINAAYSLEGPELVVRTVKEFTGLPIHNYIEVDLAGFQNLVDALGGVRICVDQAMNDPLAGLDIPRAGCYTFDGDRALAFVRARHIQGDIVPDFSRIARQQQFMRAMMNRLVSVRNLLDSEVIEEAVGNVRTDERLSGADLLYLGQQLRRLAEEDPSGARSLDFRVVPGTPQTIDEVAYVVPEADAGELFRRLEDGRPLGRLGLTLAQTLPSPGIIKVRVLEAGSISEAEDAERLLLGAGFVLLETEQAQAGQEASEILYRPGAGPRAERVAGYFALPVREVSAGILGNAEVAVVVGHDFGEVAEG
jgi:LCP family protein required for cell wall assembly